MINVPHCARDLAGDFKKKAYDSQFIKAIGRAGQTGTAENGILYSFYSQVQNPYHTEGQKMIVDNWEMDRTIVEACRISFQSIIDIEDEKWDSDLWWGFYLGSNFSDIPVGTIYVQEMGVNRYRVYEVIGILKKGAKFATAKVLENGDGNEYDSFLPLDNAVIRVTNGKEHSGAWTFVPEDGVSILTAENYLKELAQDMKLQDIQFVRLQDQMVYQGKDSMIICAIWEELLLLIMVCGILILLCAQIMETMGSRYEMGVLYSLGFYQKDIMGVVFFSNMLKGMLSFAICWIITQRIWIGYANRVNKYESMMRLLRQDVFSILAFITILFAFVMTFPSLVFYTKAEPADLIQAK